MVPVGSSPPSSSATTSSGVIQQQRLRLGQRLDIESDSTDPGWQLAFCPDHWVISTIESDRIIGLIDGVVRRSDDLGCKAASKRVVAESSSLPSQRSLMGLEFAGNKAKTFLTAEVLDDR